MNDHMRRQEDSGIQRIASMLENRFDRMEDRFVRLNDTLTDLAVQSEKNATEIINIKSREVNNGIYRWGIAASVLGAWAAHLLNWFGRGGK